jgi:cytochrome c-type biogenesis protein CcmH
MKQATRLAYALLWVSALLAAIPAVAVDTVPALPTPQLQERYYRLTHELRCMQCQNEALADSPVGLAADLRLQVRELLIAGQSDEQIRQHMVDRYSEFILFRPRMSWRNAWLWSAPVVLMLAGLIIAWRVIRSRSRLVDAEEADPNAESLNP